MRHLIILTALALAGCAKSTEIYDASGQKALMIECNGFAIPMSKCFEKANEVCPTGYILLGASEHGAAMGGTPAGFVGGTGVHQSIIVRWNV